MPSARRSSSQRQRSSGLRESVEAKRLGRRLAAAEDHVPVQVAAVVGRGRVLVTDEGGEVSRIVVRLRGVDDRLPGSGQGVVPPVLGQGCHLAAAKRLDGSLEAANRSGLAQIGPEFGVVEGTLGVVHFRQDAQVEAVIGHSLEVESARLQLDLMPTGVLDRFTLGEPVGVVGVCARPEQVGIEGVASVYVEVTEVGVVKRVGPGAVAGPGATGTTGFLVAAVAAEEDQGEDGEAAKGRANRAHDVLLVADRA